MFVKFELLDKPIWPLSFRVTMSRPRQWVLVIGSPMFFIFFLLQGGFFNWSALKMTKSQTLRKFWHLELFWRDLHVIWHLVIFWADQLKKPPCMYDNAMATKKGRVLFLSFSSHKSQNLLNNWKQCIAISVFKFLSFKIHAHNPCWIRN